MTDPHTPDTTTESRHDEDPAPGDKASSKPASSRVAALLWIALLGLALLLSLLLCEVYPGQHIDRNPPWLCLVATILLGAVLPALAWWLGRHSAARAASAGSDALTRANESLQQRIRRYRATEATLRRARNELEQRVERQTTELNDATRELQAEIVDRRAAEEKFRLVVEGSPNAMIIVDRRGKIVFVNAQTERLFGYSRDELIGHPIEQLVPERLRERHRPLRDRYLRAPQARWLGGGRDLPARRKDGSEFPVEIGLNAIRIDAETLVLSVVVDITERRKAEERLQTLSRVVEQSPNAVMVTDPKARIEYVNPRFTDVTGYSANEVIGKNPHILQSGGTSPEVYQELWRLVSSGREWRGVIRDRKKSGERYWARESISSIKDANGQVTHYVSIIEDITDQKRIEEALQESEERFRQMADMAGEWIWEQNPEGRYIYCSSAVKAIVGYRPEEVVGRFFYELFTVEDRQHVVQEQYVADNREPFFGLTNHYRHKDGRTVITESTGAPILDAEGRLVKWRGVDRDITERLRAEEEIRRVHVTLAVAKNEMKIARQIQESLLPGTPLDLPGLCIHGHCIPAAQVGGDYFDYIPRQDGCVDIVIADVSGHSVGPALFMVETRSALRTQSDLCDSPSQMLTRMNETLYDDLNQADHFITMFYMRYDRARRQLTYANAGQCPPLLLRPGETSCTELDAEGLVLGVLRDVAFEEKTLVLTPGDMIFLYTDGVIEAENPDGECFGSERLCEMLAANSMLGPQQLIQELTERLRAFREQKGFVDDVTIVILKVDSCDGGRLLPRPLDAATVPVHDTGA